MAEMGAAHPGAGRVVAMLILKRAFDDIYLLAAPMPVRIELCPGCPTHKRYAFGAVGMERQHCKTWNGPGGKLC